MLDAAVALTLALLTDDTRAITPVNGDGWSYGCKPCGNLVRFDWPSYYSRPKFLTPDVVRDLTRSVRPASNRRGTTPTVRTSIHSIKGKRWNLTLGLITQPASASQVNDFMVIEARECTF